MDFPPTSKMGFALLYTERMWVMPFLDRLSLFSASETKKNTRCLTGGFTDSFYTNSLDLF